MSISKYVFLYPSVGSVGTEPEMIDLDFDTKDVCCACLSKNPSHWLKNETAESYRNITGIELTNDLPNQICQLCNDSLKQSDDFRTKCLESYEWLIKVRQRQLAKDSIAPEKKTEYDLIIENIDEDDLPLIVKKESAIKNTYSSDSDTENYETLDQIKEIYVKSEHDYAVSNQKTKKKKVPVKKTIKKSKPLDSKKKPVRVRKTVATVKDELTELDDLIDKYFVSKVLSKEEQLNEFLKRKESKSYTKSKYKCEICYKGFGVEETYDSHMLIHTDKYGTFICDICKAQFVSPRKLKDHTNKNHKMLFSCRQCDYQAPNKSTATLHINWHSGKTYKCKHCNMEFARKSTLLSHVRIKHPSDYVCGFCGYSFIGKRGLNFHKRMKHMDEKIPVDGPKCDECNITFINEEALSAHTRTSMKHGGVKRNTFEVKYRKRDKITGEYIKKIREKKPVKCELCGEVSVSMHSYKFHFNKYHSNSTITEFPEDSNPHLCFVCGKTFTSFVGLYTHQQRHEFPGKEYECDVCKKVFKTEASFKVHKRMHERGTQIYACKLCNKVFNDPSNRNRHMSYVHTALRTEKCDFCEKTFKCKASKSLHQDYVHLKKPYKKRNRGKSAVLEGNTSGVYSDYE